VKKLRAVHPSKVEVVRHDLHPLIMGLARNMADGAERNEIKFREQEALWKYDTPECLWYVLTRVQEQPRPRWKAEVISGLPPKVLVCAAYSTEERHVEADLRMQFAKEVMALKLVRDWDDARARAAKLKLLVSERRLQP